MKKLKYHSRLPMLVVLCAIGVSCNESLPPYGDPKDVFSARNDALYVISITDNSLKAFVYVINTFDETFDSRAFIDGTVTLSLASTPSFRKTFIVSPNNILSGKYNSSSQQLTINPGDTLKFLFSWNLLDDNGRDIRDLLVYHKDPICQERWISDPQTITLRSEVKVYEKIDFTTGPLITYTFVHHREWFHPKDCTSLPR